jgi:hypothetical protein
VDGVDLKLIFGFPVLLPFGTFGDLISTITTFLFALAFIVAFFFIIYGGFRWITSGQKYFNFCYSWFACCFFVLFLHKIN